MKNNSNDPRLKRGKKENDRHKKQAKRSAKKKQVMYDEMRLGKSSRGGRKNTPPR
tara:strand:+ start:320 stop:484 length:165 start_codon:yes stop_codon:yes gene_type:complete